MNDSTPGSTPGSVPEDVPGSVPEDIAALRAADPAASAEPSAQLRARVEAIADDAAAPISLDAARVRRRWLTPVAAAAALTVGLGGGYLLSDTGSTPVSPVALPGAKIAVAVGTPENPAAPIALGGAGAAGGTGTREAAGSTGSAGAPELLTGPRAVEDAALGAKFSTEPMYMPWFSSQGRRFIIPAFEDAASTATTYALDGGVRYSAAAAEAMAAALGVTGTAYQEAPENGWTVGDPTSPGSATLWLSPSGAGDVNVSGGVTDPYTVCWNEVSPQFGLDTGAAVDESAWQQASAATEACLAATPMPTEQQAREALSMFLSATGVDEATTQVTVTADEYGRTVSASAARIAGGNVTTITSTVMVSANGLLYAYGSTGDIISLGDYDIVSPAEAAARLNDPVFAPTYATVYAPVEDSSYVYEPRTAPPAPPAAGTRVPWGISEFEIVSARLGLTHLVGADDVRFLAPAYEFTDSEGNVWSVLALAESTLDPAATSPYASHLF